MKVKCAFCQDETNKMEKTEMVRIDEKNFHPECAKKYEDKKELIDLINKHDNLKIFNFLNNKMDVYFDYEIHEEEID